MRRFASTVAAVLMRAGSIGVSGQSRPAVVEVYKSPTCGCCTKWTDHLRSHGFEVRVTNTEKIDELKTKHGVPRAARSCHTALVGGDVIEGHVPAADVQRLLKDLPAIAGIALILPDAGPPVPCRHRRFPSRSTLRQSTVLPVVLLLVRGLGVDSFA